MNKWISLRQEERKLIDIKHTMRGVCCTLVYNTCIHVDDCVVVYIHVTNILEK